MPTLAESPDAKNRLIEIEPNEVSVVDVPANGEPFLVVKGVSNQLDISKANEPKDSMSNDELKAARDARSKEYGIEVLEEGSHLTYPSGYPTNLDDYGDPCNLKYPTDTKKRAANARVRFKQNADAYKKKSSKKVVHTRIVTAELKYGIEPEYDSSDVLDQMLPSNVKDQMVESSSTKKQGGTMSKGINKLDESHVPRPVMKAVHTRLQRIIGSVEELNSVAKNMNASENGANQAPQFLINMTKSISADIRSLLPDEVVPTSKRGSAESVVSLHQLTKRAETIQIQKNEGNAVSYLTRDQYVSVTQSVSEYLTTYVHGIEHDSDGPRLIPEGLDMVVDKTSGSLDTLVDEYAPESVSEDQSSVEKYGTTLKTGIDFSGKIDELKKSLIEEIRQISKIVESSNEESSMSDETTTTTVGSDDQMTETAEEGESKETTAEATSTIVEKDSITKTIEALSKRFDEKFDVLMKSIDEVRGVATAANEKVEKFSLARADSKGGEIKSTTKAVSGGSGDSASFKDILSL